MSVDTQLRKTCKFGDCSRVDVVARGLCHKHYEYSRRHGLLTSRVTNLKKPTTTDLAWAVGIVDGEGCISLIRIKRYDSYGTGVTFDLRLDVANTDPRMPARLKTLFGGSICPNTQDKRPNRRPTWGWHIHGAKAAAVLRAMRPYFCIKGEQADVAILSRNFVRHNKRVNLVKTCTLIDLSQELKDLKRVNYPLLEVVDGSH